MWHVWSQSFLPCLTLVLELFTSYYTSLTSSVLSCSPWSYRSSSLSVLVFIKKLLDLPQVHLSWILKSERSELQCACMRSRNDRASDEVSRSTFLAWMDFNHIINPGGKKLIDICCVGSGVKSPSLFYWSIVVTSPVEFSTGEFRANQEKKGLFSESKKSCVRNVFSESPLIRTLWHGVASVTHSGFVQIFGSQI